MNAPATYRFIQHGDEFKFVAIKRGGPDLYRVEYTMPDSDVLYWGWFVFQPPAPSVEPVSIVNLDDYRKESRMII